jgi:5'-nucleotidase
MNILITNDDGIKAKGLNILYRVLAKDHNVFAIAPDQERSACSNAITIRSSLKLKKISSRKYSLSGLPADCVGIGLHAKLIPEIDLVVSGINHGPNLGDDIFFSGTVAGARTAYIFGTNSLAFSINNFEENSLYLEDAATFLLEFISKKKKQIKEEQIFFNINYPDLPKNKIKGSKYTFLGKRIYQDFYKKSNLNKKEKEMDLQLTGNVDSVASSGSDSTELKNNYISITPLTIDCTDFVYLDNLKLKK